MYNLSEEKHIFLHVTYSMLEEGYDIDEILGMWILADKEKVSEVMESLTLTEDIDLGNQDLADITAYYFKEGSSAAAANAPKVWNWLYRLFGRGRRIQPPKVKTPPKVTTQGGRPITSSSQRPQTGPASTKVTTNKTGTLADKVKQNLPKIVVPAGAIGTGLVIGGSNVSPPIPAEPEKDNTPPEPEKGKVYTDPEGNQVQFPKIDPPPPVPKDDTSSSSSSSGRNRRYGGWRLQNLEKDLYKRSPGYQVSLKAYKNIRANPRPSIYDNFDLIADYLINEGHASDIEEANYVMQQLDEDFIQSIIESSCGGSHKKKKKKK